MTPPTAAQQPRLVLGRRSTPTPARFTKGKALASYKCGGAVVWRLFTLFIPTSPDDWREMPADSLFKSAPEGTRWITVHPNGKEEPGVPVLIKESPANPGEYYIVGGAGGRLNHLKLTGIKSKDEYQEEQKKRAAEKRAKAKEEKKKLAQDGKLNAKKAADEAIANVAMDNSTQRIKAKIAQIMPILGKDPASVEFKPDERELERHGIRQSDANYAGKIAMLEYQYYQKIESQIDAIVEEKKRRLLEDETERAKAGISSLALGREHTSIEVGAAYEAKDMAEAQLASLDQQIEDAQTRNDSETVATLEAQREQYNEQAKQAAAIIEDNGLPTVDDLAGNRTKQGLGYDAKAKDRAVEAMVESGALAPDRLRELIDDKRVDQTVNQLEALGADPQITGTLFAEDMQTRAALLEEGAKLSEQGKHEAAYRKWHRAEKLLTDWELRAQKAVDKGGKTESGPGGYLDMVAQRVIEGREGMAAISAASRAGVTAVPEAVKQAQVAYENLQQLMAVQKKYAAIKDRQQAAKEQVEQEAARSGYQIDSDLIRDKFHIDEMADDAALEAARKSLDIERMAHWNAALLQEAEDSGELTSQLDLSKLQLQRAMLQHVNSGAFAALGNATMIASGDVLADRPVVDVFGVKGAATLLAARLHETLDGGKFGALLDGLEAYHGETSTEAAQAAYERAQANYQQARSIALNAKDNADDPVAMQYLNDERRALLESTLADLGRTIGGLRAQAELVNALKKYKPGDGRYAANLPIGNMPTDAIIQHMAAMGLDRDEYDITQDADSGTRSVAVAKSALPKLLPSHVTQEDVEAAAQAQAIKMGQRDEAGWLPHGVANRPISTFDSATPEPPRFAVEPDFKGKSGADLEEHTADYIGSRIADGWPVESVLADLRSASFHAQHFDAPEPGGMFDMFSGEEAPGRNQAAEVDAAVEKLLPSMDTSQKMTAESVQAYKAQREKLAQQLAEQFRAKRGLSADSIHTQGIEMDRHAMEAAHRALAKQPAAVVAFKPTADLSLQDKNALRGFFWKHLSIEGQSASIEAKKKEQAKKDEAKAAPSGMESMFGGDDLFGATDPRLQQKYGPDDTIEVEDWTGQKRAVNARAWQAERRASLFGASDDIYGDDTGRNGEMGEEEPTRELAARHAWDRYLQAHGNDSDAAYRSVQEHLKGTFNQEFAANYSRLSGRPLKQGKVALTRGQAHSVGLSPADKYQERLAAMQNPMAREMADVGRGSSGKFVAGGRREAAESALNIRAEDQRSLFQDDEAQRGEQAPMRTMLGDRAEGQIASLLNASAHRWNPKADPVGIFSISMGDNTEKGQKFYKQQRAVKMLDVQPKLGLFFGAGSGKSLTTIGMYTHLNHQGKAKRALFAVPSVVQKQFGGEALNYLDPAAERGDGRHGYKWHADAGASQAERFKAYKDGNTDFMVLTHEGLRDDTLEAVAQHRGISRADATSLFNGMSRKQRAEAVKAAFDHMGWHGFDMLYTDEAHIISNREGKHDSTKANVLNAIGDMARYHVRGTGTPVKNDASEAFDHLSQLDGERFSDRSAFMRQYGGNTAGSRAALQRLTARYFYQDKVESGVQATSHRPPLKLTQPQREQYNQVQEAYNKLKGARLDAKREKREVDPAVLIESMRILSPNSFKGLPEDQHLAKAKQLLPAYGTIRDAAFNRVINAGRFEDNAKMQEVARLADEYKKGGKPGVVFARNLETVAELERGLKARGHRVVTLTGAMSGDEKDKARLAFAPASKREQDATADIIILSDAGNTGLNLQRGKWLAHIDTPMTSPVKEQRDARINRLGQTQDVDIHELLTDTPFDGKAMRRLRAKAETSHVFQDPSHTMDDTGLAAHINQAYQRQTGGKVTRLTATATGTRRKLTKQAA